MKRKVMTTLALAAALPLGAWAQATPVGLWRNIDDSTHEARAEIRIAATASGALNGKIEKTLVSSGEPNCVKCSDDRKDQPKLGMEIIRGAKKAGDDDGLWDSGKILDPDNGKEYTLKLRLLDGGKSLQVRGYIGPFFRTQVWQRIE